MNGMTTGTIHVVTIICHTIILIALITAVVVLSADKHLDTTSIGILGTLAGITGGGLVINGRKVPQPGQRAEDVYVGPPPSPPSA